MPHRRIRLAPIAALAVFCLASIAAQVQAQEPAPAPIVGDVNRRNGMITRFDTIVPNLPPDTDRDIWDNTRWVDKHDSNKINSPFNGGLYGRKYTSECTACYPPYFAGSAGRNTLDPAKFQKHRLLGNFVHPFKPVCAYYAGGCFVPVYDLDPVVPGPGAFPFPHFFKRPNGG